MKKTPVPAGNDRLFEDIRSLLEETRTSVATTVNTALTMMYWQIGKRINEELLSDERAEYGEAIVSTVSRQLSWSHFRELLPLEKLLQQEFYTEMCRVKRAPTGYHPLYRQKR